MEMLKELEFEIKRYLDETNSPLEAYYEFGEQYISLVERIVGKTVSSFSLEEANNFTYLSLMCELRNKG